jgi:hypothetical protein
MHPAKLTLQVLCLVGLFFFAVKSAGGSWLDVIVSRPLLQTTGFLLGVSAALLVSGPALTNIGAELGRLSGTNFVVAVAKPILGSFALVFLPLSVLVFGLAVWRDRRGAEKGVSSL